MNSLTIKRLLSNCFILMMPAMAWNIALTNKLPKVFQPEIFQHDIPVAVTWGESVSRFVLFGLALLTTFSLSSRKQKRGLTIYVAGTILYFASWLCLIYLPQSAWSNSVAGFMAPAYTPLLWLMGISLVGDQYYFDLPYNRWLFPTVSGLFLVFHNVHTYMVYCKVGY